MRLLLCSCPPSDADRIARVVVEERLAACVSAWPVQSVYRWDGAVLSEPEVTLCLKTAVERVDALRARLIALHPYEVPEVLVLDVDAAASHPAYVAWVQASTQLSEP